MGKPADALFVCLAAILCSGAASADDAAAATEAREPVVIKTSATAGEIRDYKVDFKVKSAETAPGSKTATTVGAAATYKIRHRYTRREGDGLLPLEIILLQGQLETQGQRVEIAPSLYPKITVLLDRDWRIVDVFGISESRFAQGVPGIHYGNLVILFFLYGGHKPAALGDRWSYTVKLPSCGEAYSFVATLEKLEEHDGVKAAAVRQEIVRSSVSEPSAQAGSMKATVESVFAVENGKLLKSHVECEAVAPSDAGTAGAGSSEPHSTPVRANITIDIALVK